MIEIVLMLILAVLVCILFYVRKRMIHKHAYDKAYEYAGKAMDFIENMDGINLCDQDREDIFDRIADAYACGTDQAEWQPPYTV